MLILLTDTIVLAPDTIMSATCKISSDADIIVSGTCKISSGADIIMSGRKKSSLSKDD